MCLRNKRGAQAGGLRQQLLVRSSVFVWGCSRGACARVSMQRADSVCVSICAPHGFSAFRRALQCIPHTNPDGKVIQPCAAATV